jgi:hypothetical protein
MRERHPFMNNQNAIDKSIAYCISQGRDRYERVSATRLRLVRPAITISHETGTAAPEIAQQLAHSLQMTEFKGPNAWGVFNHQIIERALEEQRWPKHLAEKITEEKRFFLTELIDDVLDLQPPSWVLMPQVIETMLSLAVSGHAILLGHGATVVTAKLTNVFHVRLTGSLSKRTARVQQLKNLTPEAAADFVKTEDRRRERFLKAHFHTRLDNELLYDLAINTDRVSNDDAVAVISEAARRFFSAF